MIKHKELVDAVASHAGIRAVIAAVISTLSHRLPPEQRQRWVEQLPGPVENAADVPGQTERVEGTEVITEVAHRLDTTPEQARYLAQAVLAGLRDNAPELTGQLSQHLDSEVRTLLAPVGEPPGEATSNRAEVPTELSDDEVANALRRLTGWSGDRHGISRTVTLPEDRLGPLIDRVQREARERNDHAHTARQRDGVTFTLRTGNPGVVTGPDVELAERIDQILLNFGSGG